MFFLRYNNCIVTLLVHIFNIVLFVKPIYFYFDFIYSYVACEQISPL